MSDRDASRGRTRDRGAADALGLVLIAPAVVGLAILVFSLGRRVDAQAQVRSAAESAAQAAALERNGAAANAAADTVARSMLVDSDTCSAPTVSVVYPSLPPPGSGINGGLVEVTLTCAVSDRGIELVQRGSRDETVTAVATVDFFRARR